MNLSIKNRIQILPYLLVLSLALWPGQQLNTQDLFYLIDQCEIEEPNLKQVVTTTIDYTVDVDSRKVKTTDSYDELGRIVRSVTKSAFIDKEISFFYYKGRLVKETSKVSFYSGGEEEFNVFYQYYQNKISRVSVATLDGALLRIASLYYDKKNRPVLLKFHKVNGEYSGAQTAYYLGNGTVAIENTNQLDQVTSARKFLLCHRYTPSGVTEKNMFESKGERLIRHELNDDQLTVVRGPELKGKKAKEAKRAMIKIEQVQLNPLGNWTEIMIYELKKKKNKRRKIQKVEREFIYYQ